MVVADGIRVLAGGNYDAIMNTFGISKSRFHYACNKFLKAVLSCASLGTKLPTTTPVQWENIHEGFAFKSWNQVLKGCMGALETIFSGQFVQL
jgi:hypothetical protein